MFQKGVGGGGRWIKFYRLGINMHRENHFLKYTLQSHVLKPVDDFNNRSLT